MRLKELNAFGKLMSVLCDMERDLGLDGLSEPERRVLSAISMIIGDSKNPVNSRDVKSNPICRDLTDPTYYRALKNLVEAGYIEVIEGRKTGIYKLVDCR
jgi:DNA-binding MarR family transcriptional regulator